MTAHKTTFILTIGTALAAHLIVSAYYQQYAKTPAVDAPKELSSLIQQATLMSANNGGRPRLDLAFCIDTTGSMQGEIDMVKAKVKAMVAKLSSGQPKPIVRVGLVAYRDKGDAYVTKVFPFSENIDQVVKDISDLTADGGGDGPEAVDNGLHSALNELKWDSNKKTGKLLFLIGDAPPHVDKTDYDWKTETAAASAHGIRINTIGCDGLDAYTDPGSNVFKKIATLTNGKFETLSYHQEIVDSAGHRETLITSGGVTYKVKTGATVDWKKSAETLVSSGLVERTGAAVASGVIGLVGSPALQGATNGTIGPQGSDATYITGVNTAGCVTTRSDNNLDSVMLQGAQDALARVSK